MREHAKELGIELPETPPAKLMTAAERRAKMEQMRNMTPEERMAARAETYKQLRERAAAQGIELPETPPWEEALQRRKAMQEKWEAYRKEIDAMTEEQREASKAVFGASPMADAPGMPMQRPPMEGPMNMPMQPQMPPMDMGMQRQMPPMDMPMQRQMPAMDMPMQRQMPPMDMPMQRQMPPMDMPMRGQAPGGYGQGPCPQGDCGGMMKPPVGGPNWEGNQGGYGAPRGRGY
jgi:hypothetical protein